MCKTCGMEKPKLHHMLPSKAETLQLNHNPQHIVRTETFHTSLYKVALAVPDCNYCELSSYYSCRYSITAPAAEETYFRNLNITPNPNM